MAPEHYSARNSTGTLVLLLACLLATLPFASATATVSFGTCAVNSARACVNTTVTFSGTDLADVASVRISLSAANAELITCGNVTASATAVTCSLAVAASVNDGVYPVTLVLSGGATVDAGSLAVGTFLEASGVAGWTNTSGSSAYRVTGQSSSWPSTGDVWSVRGTFNTASTYSIVFYNSQPAAVAGSPGTPTCSPVTVTATTLSCTITSANGVMGMYNFLVKDTTNNALLLGSSSLYKIAVNPPLPEVTGASGSCATSSAACVSGASLTITGTNFNYRSAAYQKFFVGVTSAQRSAIQLTPTAAAKSGVTATLRIEGNVAAGSYPIFVKLQVCMMGMMSPLRYVGNLVLHEGSVAGFNMNMPLGETSSEATRNPPHMSGGYITAVVFACVFGVLLLIVLSILVVYLMREHKRRERWRRRAVLLANLQRDTASCDFAMLKLPRPATPYGDEE